MAKDPKVLVFNKAAGEVDEEVWKGLPEKARNSGSQDAIRLVLFEGCPLPVPCGGTHVQMASEIGEVTIKKILHKEGILRISYRIHP